MTAVPDASPVTEVTARPIRMSQIGFASAAVVFVVFAVTAVLMPRDNAGATFGDKDQLGTFVLGIVLAGLLHHARPVRGCTRTCRRCGCARSWAAGGPCRGT